MGLLEEDIMWRRVPSSAGRCGGAWEGSLSAEEQLGGLLEEGKGLLRRGRELSRGGVEYGEADALLQDAMACFEEAAAIDSSSTKVLVRALPGPWHTGSAHTAVLSAAPKGPLSPTKLRSQLGHLGPCAHNACTGAKSPLQVLNIPEEARLPL